MADGNRHPDVARDLGRSGAPKASQRGGKFPIVLCQRSACPGQRLLPEFERLVEPSSPAGPIHPLLLLRSKEFVMHAFRKLLVATLASTALAVPMFGYSALTCADAHGTAEGQVVRNQYIGPYLNMYQADAAGRNAVRAGRATSYDPPYHVTNLGPSRNGWYVLLHGVR
jgi:hypothetical protein